MTSTDATRKPGADAGILTTLRESPVAVKALLAGVFVNRLGTFLQIYLVLFLTARGFSELQAGFALGCYGLGSVVGVVIGGELADRLGVRRAILLSMVGTATFVLAVLYVRHYPSLLVAVAMVSMVGQVYRPASAAMLAELTPQHRRVMIFAMQRLALNLGATASPLIGVALLTISYDLLFWVQAVTELGFAAIAMLILPRRPGAARPDEPASGPTPAAMNAKYPAGQPDGAAPVEPALARASRGYLAVLADRPFVLFLCAFMINSIVYLQYVSVLPLAMHEAGLATIWYSSMITLNGFIVISFELLATKVVQRWPMRIAAAVGFALLGAGLAIYAIPGGAAVFVLGTLTWTLAEIVAGPTMSAYPATVAPDHLRGRYIGTAQAVFGIGAAIGPIVGVMVWNLAGRGVWLGYGLICLLGLAVAWIGMAPKGAALPSAARPARPVSGTPAAPLSRLARFRTRAEPAALTLTLAYAEDTWSLTASRRGSMFVQARQLTPSEALKVVATIDAVEVQAVVEELLAEQRAQAQAESQRLRAALAESEARVAEISAREAELAKLRGSASLPGFDRLPESRPPARPSNEEVRKGMKRYVVLVDPVRAGQEYLTAFREAGVEPVAVLSTSAPALPHREVHLDNVAHVHVFDGDLAGLADALQAYAPLCVIPASETGVELADALGELVAPGTGNVAGLTAARRDKWAMAQAAQKAGLAHPRQICGDDLDVIDRWLRDTGLYGTRLVVKPPKSAGADNVHIVPAGADWRPHFDQIYRQVNKLGLINEAVLVSEFVEGTEFMIDSYSVDGEHGLVDVCRYIKKQRGDRIGLYDLIDFLPPDDPEVALVWPYVQKVLDAVGIRNGCGHTEVILTSSGPTLVELAARPAGGGHQMITKLATGSNHITRTVAHRARGEFRDGYELIQYVCSVVISAPHAGIWRNAEIFDDVDSLATFHQKYLSHGTGEHVPATDDIYTMLGWVVLASSDKQAVEADYRQIKDLERQLRIDPVELVAPTAAAAGANTK